jgi:hypothetical protein
MQTFDAGASKVRHPFEILCSFALKPVRIVRGWKSRAGILPLMERLAPVISPCPDRLEALSYVISG